MSLIFYGLINTVFVLLISPLFISLVKKAKAFTQGREGPPLLQTYYMLGKLLRKENVYSSNSSAIMRITPYVNIVFLLTASLFVPLVFVPRPAAGIGNIILFLYLMVAAKFFMALSGLDAGSAFGGMGSSREMTFSAVMEPVIIVVFASLAFILRTTNLLDMFAARLESSVLVHPALILSAISLFIILIVESSRIPVDNPETHLELTMIHEAMILEYSGPNLVLMELSHAVKQTLLMGVLINILTPWGLTLVLSPSTVLIAMAAFLLKAGALSVLVGLFESSFAKARLFRLPNLFFLAYFFSFATILFELLS